MKKRLMEMGIPEEKATEIMNLLNREINSLKENHKKEINSIKLETALEKAVALSGAKTQKAVEALIDKEKISTDEKGNFKGIDEQLKALKENEETKYLFANKDEIPFKGVSIGIGEKNEKSIDDMNYEELCAYLEN